MITTMDFVYPVLMVDTDGYTMVSLDEDTLTTLNVASIKRGGCKGGVVVDSTGVAAKVLEINIISGIGPFWGYTIWLDRVCRVELQLGEPFDMPFEKARSIVAKDLKRGLRSVDPDYRRQTLQEVQQVQTIQELIDVLLPHADFRDFIRSVHSVR